MSSWRETWGFGEAGERLAFDALRVDGWSLVNTAKASESGAPVLAGLRSKHVLPDLLGFRDGRTAWFEVKSKTDCIEFRKTNELRHGFEKRNYQEYQTVAALTDAPVYLLIYEKRRQTLLRARLSELSVVDETTAEQADADYNSDGMVFFTRDQFKDRVSAARFDGVTYIRKTPLNEVQQPLFNDRETIDSWTTATLGNRRMICHYCQTPIQADDPRWIMGEPCCNGCHIIDPEER